MKQYVNDKKNRRQNILTYRLLSMTHICISFTSFYLHQYKQLSKSDEYASTENVRLAVFDLSSQLVMKRKLEQLIERFCYIKSCVTEKEAMIWESVLLSEDQIENAFNTKNQLT